MRQQLIQYVELLFAGAPGSEEIKQEILYNTLDRYDDLVAQGKTPEAAYRLAISGIGDINEILGREPEDFTQTAFAPEAENTESQQLHPRYRAVAIAMYILCPVPLIILSELGFATLGLCMLLLLVAAATYLIILSKKETHGGAANAKCAQQPEFTSDILRKRKIAQILSPICLVAYLLTSILTGAWYITWLIFPIFACIRGLIQAILDLKEEFDNES